MEELHKKTLEEDPSAFDYDGVYDQMKEKQILPKTQERKDRVVLLLVRNWQIHIELSSVNVFR